MLTAVTHVAPCDGKGASASGAPLLASDVRELRAYREACLERLGCFLPSSRPVKRVMDDDGSGNVTSGMNDMSANSAPSSMPSSDSPAEQAKLKQRKDYLVGIALLLLVVLLWTSSNFLTNNILLVTL